MPFSTFEGLVADARALLDAGLGAVDAGEALRRSLRLDGDTLETDGERYALGRGGRTLVLGGGKAAAAMAAALGTILPDRIDQGLVVVKDGHRVAAGKIDVREAGHPVPDARGAAAAAAVLGMAEEAGGGDLAVVLLSGGASALLSLPVEQITLEEKRAVTGHLLRAGATIGELNTVRKHLSRIKGGRLARAAAPARTLCLIVSDVVGDPLDVIASGPTAPDSTTFSDALSVLERYDPDKKLPSGPRDYLREGESGKHPETLKPGAPELAGVHHVIVANNSDALEAVRAAAAERGYDARVVSGTLEGEAREAAAGHARKAGEVRADRPSNAPPVCLVWGGETTVTVRGAGRGGRNTECALAFAMQIEGLTNVVGLFAGTDGTDGPTDAAGAIVTGETAARARRMNLDPRTYLDQNDSYSFFEQAGGLLITGPTMTNVMALHIVLIG